MILQNGLTADDQKYPKKLVKAIVDSIFDSLCERAQFGEPQTNIQEALKESTTLANEPMEDEASSEEEGSEMDQQQDDEEEKDYQLARKKVMRDAMHDLGVADIPPQWQNLVRKAHVNKGHPPKQDFLRVLRVAQAKPEVIAWARDHFKCPQCEQQSKSKWRRRFAVPRTYHFNRIVAADLFYFEVEIYRSQSLIYSGSRYRLSSGTGG